MTRPVCSYDKYCFEVSEAHWRKFSHPGRSSRTKIRLFHGTKCKHGGSIHAGGLKPSTVGRLGPGAYFTIRDGALEIAEHRGHGSGVYIIELEVDVGHLKVLKGQEEDKNGSWSSQGYNTCKSIHPAWIVDYSFPEWCVEDPSRLKIIGTEQIGGTTRYSANINGKMSLSDGTVILKNSGAVARINGSAIVKSNNGSISATSNTGGSVSVMSNTGGSVCAISKNRAK